MDLKPTLTFIHDTRRIKDNGTYPVKLRITYRRKQKYYPTGIDLFPPEWEKLHGERIKKEFKSIKDELISIQAKGQEIVNSLKTFSFQTFDAKFTTINSAEAGLFGLFNTYISQLKKESRISTAISYNASLKSLKSFKPKFDFEDVSPDFLKSYEAWMKREGNSITSVGIYLRALRTIFNNAISTGIISNDLYPFGKRKYQIPTGKNTKKALALADIKKIYDYPTLANTTEQKAKDLWMFTYLCNGINMKDIARLKFKNWQKDTLNFIRAKTEKSTRTNPQPISIYLQEDAIKILKRWANKDKQPDNYIFPILKAGMTPETEYAAIQQLTKTVNKYIDRIAQSVGIEKHVTTYTARHTFSTVLKRSGASVEFIQESLGHTNKNTTQAYLDSFEQDTKRHYANKLLDFKE